MRSCSTAIGFHGRATMVFFEEQYPDFATCPSQRVVFRSLRPQRVNGLHFWGKRLRGDNCNCFCI